MSISDYSVHMVTCENVWYRQHIPKASAVGVPAANITDFSVVYQFTVSIAILPRRFPGPSSVSSLCI